jgi:hypothetical protein
VRLRWVRAGRDMLPQRAVRCRLESPGGHLRRYDIPAADAAAVPITGTPAQAAERFAAYADASATWLVLGRSTTTGGLSGS